MLWKGRRQSSNVEDQRRFGAKSLGAGGLIVGAIIYYLLGGNPVDFLLQNATQIQVPQSQMQQRAEDEQLQFVSVVLADTEDVWRTIFAQKKITYVEPKLIAFSQVVQSACGTASSAVGPFYCPLDQHIFLDLNFFNRLANSLGAQGDFAVAYVIAHEVGHHVQKLLGIEQTVRAQQQTANNTVKNQLSVQMELQADCLAGVWAHQTQQAKQVIEEGDMDEAMNAASAVGDDTLQKRTRGQVVPDSFTHGTSAQRVQAFQNGFSSGMLEKCLDTYHL